MLGIVMFLILLFFTNYVSVGISFGLAMSSLVCIIANLYFIAINLLDRDNKKNKKIISLILLILMIISMIISFFKPLVLSGLNICFSNIASIFVEPIILYMAISIYYWSTDGSETKLWSVGVKVFYIIVFTMIGIFIAGVSYFASIDGVLEFLNTNFKYENIKEINTRKSLYNSNNFEDIFPKLLEQEKKVYFGSGRDQDTIEREAFQKKRTYEGYKIYNKEKNDEHIYLLTILDTTCYDDTNAFPKYYVVVNFEKFEVVEFRKNSVGIEDDELAKKLENIEKSKDIEPHSFMFYTINKMKFINAEITCENINAQAKYLKDKNKIRCYSIENNNGEYKFTLRIERRSGIEASTGTIYSDYTFRVDY